MSYDEWKAGHKEKTKNSSPDFKRIKRELSEKATCIKPEKWVLPNNKHIDSEKIIKKIGMPDKTNGSCTSVALAYVGNKAGYKVSDFKGGITREYFSNNDNIESIAKFDGVRSKIIKSENDLRATHKLLDDIIEEKEYILATGGHTAIIRRKEDHFEYLELQKEEKKNGFHLLTDDILLKRFDCDTVHVSGNKVRNFLIDAETLENSPDFIELLGFINTGKFKE